MKRLAILLSITSIISICFVSCQYIGGQRVSGNGHITTQEKSVGSFNSVQTGGSMDVHVTQSSTPSVRIEADDNLMPYIDVYVEGNTLHIRTKMGYNLNPSKDIVAYVAAPEFKEIGVSGSGDVISDNALSGSSPLDLHVSGSGNIKMQVNFPKVSTEVSGSGDILLKGEARDFDADVSGSGKVKCFDLVTDNTNLHLTGSSDAEITANKTLDLSIAGSGTVRYKGNASVSQHVSGSGDIKKVD